MYIYKSVVKYGSRGCWVTLSARHTFVPSGQCWVRNWLAAQRVARNRIENPPAGPYKETNGGFSKSLLSFINQDTFFGWRSFKPSRTSNIFQYLDGGKHLWLTNLNGQQLPIFGRWFQSPSVEVFCKPSCFLWLMNLNSQQFPIFQVNMVEQVDQELSGEWILGFGKW